MKTLVVLFFSLMPLTSFAITPVSGEAGNIQSDHQNPGFTNNMTSFWVKEKYDKPCWVRVGFRTTWPDTIERCIGSAPSGSKGKVEVGLYITGIRVCHSSSGRVKGYTLFGKDGNGNTQVETFKRPNCDAWQQRVNCPAGEMATGVRLHFDAGSGNKSDILTGVQLHCGSAPFVE